MRHLDNYTIKFKGLKNGAHQFRFDIEGEFFGHFEGSEIEGGSLSVEIELEKKNKLLELDFHIEGTVRVQCDRCLDLFDMPIEYNNSLVVKFENGESDISEQIMFLSPEEHELPLAQYLYESIALSIPYKRIHPEDEEGNSTCSQEMINKIDELSVSEEENHEIDPRWNELKKLIKNNN